MGGVGWREGRRERGRERVVPLLLLLLRKQWRQGRKEEKEGGREDKTKKKKEQKEEEEERQQQQQQQQQQFPHKILYKSFKPPSRSWKRTSSASGLPLPPPLPPLHLPSLP